MPQNRSNQLQPNRRQALQLAAGAAVAAQVSRSATAAPADRDTSNRRIRQSIVHWCFASHGEQWSVERTCQVAQELGYESVELISPDNLPLLQKYDLTCAIVGVPVSPGPAFMRGFNNPEFHPMLLENTKKSIDYAADNGFPNVIAFTGFSAKDVTKADGPHWSLEEGANHCVEGFKRLMDYAEQKKVNVCLEMLNSRDAEDMKGHPGYQGDHTDYCIEIIKRVNSERMKLLFDIYHVQIMDGDVIRRIREHAKYIGHVHTAGNPGRRELDDQQEINYPPIMRALQEVNYQGFVGQEFIPTGDPYKGLKEAFDICDV
ncbi:MAG: TIM barrel protein [Planctomycetales bacterium]|nr:TIM barrel protein [Planctomycetales bacterium]